MVCLILVTFSINVFADSSSEILSDIGVFTETRKIQGMASADWSL